MASRIAGITIEIDGDTTKLQKSLKGVDSDLKATSAKLRDVEKLLKLDPKNTELLRQKQQALGSILGRLFLRSREMSQAMYEAMVCRGFTGDYLAADAGKLQWSDMYLCLVYMMYLYLFCQLEAVV